MDANVEHEICANCKKEIPHFNYVMHTAHCARNISLCSNCKEPFPKNQIEEHRKKCEVRLKPKKPDVPPTNLERNRYYQEQKAIADKRVEARKERYFERLEKLVDSGHSLKETPQQPQQKVGAVARPKPIVESSKNISNTPSSGAQSKPPKTPLIPCKYCELELPKGDMEDHENYCGARTDYCSECGEIVMFKYRKLHEETNHGFLKLNDEPGPKPSWESPRRSNGEGGLQRRNRPPPLQSFVDFEPPPYSPSIASTPRSFAANGEKLESSKELARRLDCKTEYIKNVLHDSASITVPLRTSANAPRNHFNHSKGPAPQPPRKRNPPTEIVIPCEFCDVPIPHEDLIQHETGCRPDLARLRRRRSPSPDDYFTAPAPSSPEVELPCEFCSDMIPASQLLRHQSTCC